MIKVEHLTKQYAGIVAIKGISFEVARGEIVGFLGPNGAGKSTTMRILASYLPPTSGRAIVAGFDVFTDSLKARRRLGYLAENVPLYHDMRVDEYLRYRGTLKGLFGRKLARRLGATKELCGLKEVGRKKIAGLSKGFRQRVGLAEANWHWLRHAHATMLDAVGAPLGTVQALLGHSSSEITREMHLHSLPADARNAAQKVEDLMIGPKRTQVPDFPEMKSTLIH